MVSRPWLAESVALPEVRPTGGDADEDDEVRRWCRFAVLPLHVQEPATIDEDGDGSFSAKYAETGFIHLRWQDKAATNLAHVVARTRLAGEGAGEWHRLFCLGDHAPSNLSVASVLLPKDLQMAVVRALTATTRNATSLVELDLGLFLPSGAQLEVTDAELLLPQSEEFCLRLHRLVGEELVEDVDDKTIEDRVASAPSPEPLPEVIQDDRRVAHDDVAPSKDVAVALRNFGNETAARAAARKLKAVAVAF